MNVITRAVTVPLVCTTLLAGSSVFGERRYERTGPDAFLQFQIDSTNELVAVLKSDPVLRRRYARHFGVSEAEIVDFIKRSLIPYRLPQSRAVTVYGVTRSGRIYGVRTRLNKGTQVWATRSGVPILKWLCANPMTKTLPGTRLARAPRVARRKRPAGGGKVASLPLAYKPASPSVEEFVAAPPAVALSPDVAAGLGGGGGAALLPVAAATAPAIGAPVGVSVPASGGGGIGALPFALLPLALLGSGGSSSPAAAPPGSAPAPALLPGSALPPAALPGEAPPLVAPLDERLPLLIPPGGGLPPVTPPGDVSPPVRLPNPILPPVTPSGEVTPSEEASPPVTPPAEVPSPVAPPGDAPLPVLPAGEVSPPGEESSPASPPEVIPEPGTFGLIALGIPSLAATRYRRRKASSQNRE
jgi:hypothetical protein